MSDRFKKVCPYLPGDKIGVFTIAEVYEAVPNKTRKLKVRCFCGREFIGNLTTLQRRESCGCLHKRFMVIDGKKRCTYCKEVKTKEYFHQKKTGLWVSRCKKCTSVCRKKDGARKELPKGVRHHLYVDLTGNVIGELTVLEYIKVPSKHSSHNFKFKWRCRCSCGDIINVAAVNLTGTNKWQVRSCPKCGYKNSGIRRVLPNELAAKRNHYTSYKAGAAARKINWELSYEDFLVLVAMDCHYCGQPPSCLPNRKKYQTYCRNGVDRVKNSEGYYFENCVPCCDMCNIMKNTYDVEAFLNKIIKIYEHSNLSVKKTVYK